MPHPLLGKHIVNRLAQIRGGQGNPVSRSAIVHLATVDESPILVKEKKVGGAGGMIRFRGFLGLIVEIRERVPDRARRGKVRARVGRGDSDALGLTPCRRRIRVIRKKGSPIMNVSISTVSSRAELKTFVKFPWRLYKGSPYWVPPLLRDEMDTLSPDRNPAFEKAEARLFLAHRDGKLVGRIAGILSHAANDKYGTKNMRFGWFDTIDDYEVAKALLDAVSAYAKEKGMNRLTGPHGFSDLDPEGLLIEGFNEIATISVIYNHPYYPGLLERYGFVKEVDYVEFQALAPEGTVIPEKMLKMGEWAQKRNHFRLLKYTSIKKLRAERAQELLELLDETFEELYGTVPLTQKQKDYYISRYISFANPEYIKIAVNEANEMVGFMLAIPSLARAQQKANGRLFPFGFIPVLRALKKYDTLDFLLAGVRKSLRGKGIDLMMTIDVFRSGLAHGVHFAESNPELETNSKIQGEWKIVNRRQHKRRRIYTLDVV